MLGTRKMMRADFVLPGIVKQPNSASFWDLLEDLSLWELSEWDDTCRSLEAIACKKRRKCGAGRFQKNFIPEEA
jgi:hypothetical protein